MSKEEEIKALLLYVLRALAEATIGMDTMETDCGTLYYPELRYMPEFEFSEDDLQLIKELEEEGMGDFSTLTNI